MKLENQELMIKRNKPFNVPSIYARSIMKKFYNIVKEEKKILSTKFDEDDQGTARKKFKLLDSLEKSLIVHLGNKPEITREPYFIPDESLKQSLADIHINTHDSALLNFMIMQNKPVTIPQFLKSYKMTRTGAYHAANRLIKFGMISSEPYIDEHIGGTAGKHYFLLDNPKTILIEYVEKRKQILDAKLKTVLKDLERITKENK